MMKRALQRIQFIKKAYHPYLPERVDQDALVSAAAEYFNLTPQGAQEEYQIYRRFHESQKYEQLLGERKTLAFEEAFLLYLAAKRIRPTQVVEIGTQYGKSTRRIFDSLRFLDLVPQVTCFDLVDELLFVSLEEVRLELHDLTGNFTQRVLEGITPQLIYMDAHPYHLLKDVILSFVRWSATHPAILAIHDCAPGLYNPDMKLSKDDPTSISSNTGLWERHVLGEVFGVSPERVDQLRTSSHHLRVFPTPHGLALLAPAAALHP